MMAHLNLEGESVSAISVPEKIEALLQELCDLLDSETPEKDVDALRNMVKILKISKEEFKDNINNDYSNYLFGKLERTCINMSDKFKIVALEYFQTIIHEIDESEIIRKKKRNTPKKG
jgi:hypothetical protein